MKLCRNIILVIIVSLFCYLPHDYMCGNAEELVQLHDDTLHQEPASSPVLYFILNNSPLQVSFPEYSGFVITTACQQVIRLFNHNFFAVPHKSKIALHYMTVVYLFDCHYICNILQKEEFIYPFYFFF